MSSAHLIQTFIEAALLIFAIWGLFNEGVLARLERKLFAKFRRNSFKVHKTERCNYKAS